MASSNFVDQVNIYLRSGKGGAGSVHFHRDRFTSKGGPDGGDGGRGGHIIIRGNRNMWTLLHLRYKKHIFAQDGCGGASAKRKGADGEDVIIDVPLGTLVKDHETHELLVEVVEHDEEKILLYGGRGGLGNEKFKSPTNQCPDYAQPGELGSEGWFTFELKILADVGLVGFPNAGKSTFLSVVSAAKPEIADYPFTTLVPNLGIVNYRDNQSFIVADIPGIIEGAHEGKGLGLRFLRHIERNSMLLFLIPVDSKDIVKEYLILLKELEMYNPELLQKKRVLAITKADIIDDELILLLKQDLDIDIPFIFISSVTGFNIDKLKDMLWKQLNT
ncbi:MAG: GTPase ObgE [Bacteroidales bacterium]